VSADACKCQGRKNTLLVRGVRLTKILCTVKPTTTVNFYGRHCVKLGCHTDWHLLRLTANILVMPVMVYKQYNLVTAERAVMRGGWEDKRRSGVALTLCKWPCVTITDSV